MIERVRQSKLAASELEGESERRGGEGREGDWHISVTAGPLCPIKSFFVIF